MIVTLGHLSIVGLLFFGAACGDHAPFRPLEEEGDTVPIPDSDPVILLESIGSDTGEVEVEAATPLPEESVEVLLNPYDSAKLAAIAVVRHPDVSPEAVDEMRITVTGQRGAENLTAMLDPRSAAFEAHFGMDDQLADGEVGVPILGLFAGLVNEVAIGLRVEETWYEGRVDIPVEPIPELDEESVTVDLIAPERMAPGWTYLNGRVYDHQGNCRWMGRKIFHLLDNGNILSGIDERNWLGRNVNNRSLPGHLGFHHDAVDLPNGNIVACINNQETTVVDAFGDKITSVEDYIVELDPAGEIRNAWDMREFLDVNRGTVASLGDDWFHMNTLAYDEQDDALLVSGRFQGIVKVTRGGIRGETANAGKALVWILAPHLDWGLAGPDGAGDIDPNDYLLTAVDSNGTPYAQAVQDNLAAPEPGEEPFHWPVGQHGLEITERGEGRLSILTFNNQASFIFDGEGTVDNGAGLTFEGDLSNDRAEAPYSMIIEYEVDEIAMTVRQKWSFGEGEHDWYGGFASGVAQLGTTGNRMMISNGAEQLHMRINPYNPHVIEVAEDGEILYHFEAVDTQESAHRAGRIDLYHPSP